jgi:hypothetical protein
MGMPLRGPSKTGLDLQGLVSSTKRCQQSHPRVGNRMIGHEDMEEKVESFARRRVERSLRGSLESTCPVSRRAITHPIVPYKCGRSDRDLLGLWFMSLRLRPGPHCTAHRVVITMFFGKEKKIHNVRIDALPRNFPNQSLNFSSPSRGILKNMQGSMVRCVSNFQRYNALFS